MQDETTATAESPADRAYAALMGELRQRVGGQTADGAQSLRGLIRDLADDGPPTLTRDVDGVEWWTCCFCGAILREVEDDDNILKRFAHIDHCPWPLVEGIAREGG
jgi:hypothetical protein